MDWRHSGQVCVLDERNHALIQSLWNSPTQYGQCLSGSEWLEGCSTQ